MQNFQQTTPSVEEGRRAVCSAEDKVELWKDESARPGKKSNDIPSSVTTTKGKAKISEEWKDKVSGQEKTLESLSFQ